MTPWEGNLPDWAVWFCCNRIRPNPLLGRRHQTSAQSRDVLVPPRTPPIQAHHLLTPHITYIHTPVAHITTTDRANPQQPHPPAAHDHRATMPVVAAPRHPHPPSSSASSATASTSTLDPIPSLSSPSHSTRPKPHAMVASSATGGADTGSASATATTCASGPPLHQAANSGIARPAYL